MASAVIVMFTGTALLIRRHYADVEQVVALAPHEGGCEAKETPAGVSNLAIVPVAALNLASMRALAYVASLGQPTVAVHISPTADEANHFRDYWTTWGNYTSRSKWSSHRTARSWRRRLPTSSHCTRSAPI